MNEFTSPLSSFEQTSIVVNSLIPPDWLPRYYPIGQTRPTILSTLHGVVRDVPPLEPLASAILRTELLTVREKNAYEMSPQKLAALSGLIRILPDLPNTLKDEPLFYRQDLFLLEHDTSASWRNAWEKMYLQNRNVLPLFDALRGRLTRYSYLRYRYDEANETHLTTLTHAYARMMRAYVIDAVLPSIQELIPQNLPMGTFELHELRNAFGELVELDPTLWAESLPLRSTLERFVGSQKFTDKNTRKPVEPQFTGDSSDPVVVVDPGMVFRMARNLLRDAVTHGEGHTITPIIDIKDRGPVVELSIYSPGHLDPDTLAVIGKKPYTTQNRESHLHGYGKVGARKLLTALWSALGRTPDAIESLLKDHWSNIMIDGQPFVRWTAPLPKLQAESPTL